MQIVLNSSITAGSLAAIILNVAFEVVGYREERPDPTRVATTRTSGGTSGPV
jgi:xanthine/uracil permease